VILVNAESVGLPLYEQMHGVAAVGLTFMNLEALTHKRRR
jgi:hypothetical protein